MPTLSDRQNIMAGNSPFTAVAEGRVWDAFLDAGAIAGVGGSAVAQILPDSELFLTLSVSTLSTETVINIWENASGTPGADILFGNRNFKVAPNIPAPATLLSGFDSSGATLRYTTSILGAASGGNTANALVGGSSAAPFLLPKGSNICLEIINNDATAQAYTVNISAIEVNAPRY